MVANLPAFDHLCPTCPGGWIVNKQGRTLEVTAFHRAGCPYNGAKVTAEVDGHEYPLEQVEAFEFHAGSAN